MSARHINRRVKRSLLASLERLLDPRTPEERGVAVARYDQDFAAWQAARPPVRAALANIESHWPSASSASQ